MKIVKAKSSKKPAAKSAPTKSPATRAASAKSVAPAKKPAGKSKPVVEKRPVVPAKPVAKAGKAVQTAKKIGKATPAKKPVTVAAKGAKKPVPTKSMKPGKPAQSTKPVKPGKTAVQSTKKTAVVGKPVSASKSGSIGKSGASKTVAPAKAQPAKSVAPARASGERIPAGTWVEIEQVILTPAQRAPNVPQDTRNTSYVMHVSGFLQAAAKIGDEVKVKTLIGRELSGRLIVVDPHYTHSFGVTVPELLLIGKEDQK